MHKDSSAAPDASAFGRSWVRRSQDFSHPLLRIAAKPEGVALAYRDVRRALRVALDRNAQAAWRIEAAHDVLTFLPGLRLDPANENVFRREFLLYVCAEAPSPLLLQHLLVAELQLIEIAESGGLPLPAAGVQRARPAAVARRTRRPRTAASAASGDRAGAQAA